ncbi:hypothetical protein [Paenibacillus sp. NPDC057934]|uniref:hypothetical protein n=1 Tax=Paenibacillus sp. NPDC057934 TaxID=3346282 RepID=UPI0036DC37B3
MRSKQGIAFQALGALAKPSTSLGEKSAPHLRSKQGLAFQALRRLERNQAANHPPACSMPPGGGTP